MPNKPFFERMLSPLRRKVTPSVEEPPNPKMPSQPRQAAPEVPLGSGAAEQARKTLKKRRKTIADAIKEAGG